MALDPAIIYYSTDNDASIRIESNDPSTQEEVYLELRNQNSGSSFKIGMNNDYNLHIGFGGNGNPDAAPDAIMMNSGGPIHFYGAVEFKANIYKSYVSSGITCALGSSKSTSSSHRWTSWSSCPSGYSTVGIGYAEIHDDTYGHDSEAHPDIDHVECSNSGCRLYCRGSTCKVQSRCCKTDAAPLSCYDAGYKTEYKGAWGTPSYCSGSYSVVGFRKLDLTNYMYYTAQYINDFEIYGNGVRSWCWGSNCGVQARCCRQSNRQKLQCVSGTTVNGGGSTSGKWTPYSGCPPGYRVISMKKIDLQGSNSNLYQNMKKYECTDSGCRAFCVGSTCNAASWCCKV